ncbi:MAG: hypothetical protein CMF25_00660 [Kangiellaceae bacterium]|nr:hypothetical protein [Kangiellaceae bacterium]
MDVAPLFKQLPEMSETQFELWRRLLQDEAAVWISWQRKFYLQTCIAKRVRELSCNDYDDYYYGLQEGRFGSLEWVHLVDLLTINDTRFFRHRESMTLVEEFVRNKRRDMAERMIFETWSVGCATGEEPYSLSILFEQQRSLSPRFYYGITATDISYSALGYARKGMYPEQKLKDIPETWRKKCLDKIDNNKLQFKSDIRQRIRFVQGNILEPTALVRQTYDLIYCQNMLIYISPEQRKGVMNHFVRCLKPGGLLVIGPGEVIDWHNENVTRVMNPSCLAYVSQT